MLRRSEILPKIVKKSGYLIRDALFATGLYPVSSIFRKPGNRILLYHGIDKKGHTGINGRFISAERFESHIRYLSDHVNIVPLRDFFEKDIPEKDFSVAITFDDGYRNNLDYAAPVLRKYKVPATFFITGTAALGGQWLWTDFLDVSTWLGPDEITINGQIFKRKRWRHSRFYVDNNGNRLSHYVRSAPLVWKRQIESAFLGAGVWKSAEAFADYWKLLSPEDIRELADQPGMTIGAHGFHHFDLTRISFREACSELEASKRVLEKTIGKTIGAMAYPFGAYTQPLLDHAEKIGFTFQLAVDFQNPENFPDTRLRERLTINPYISETNQWLAVRNGHY